MLFTKFKEEKNHTAVSSGSLCVDHGCALWEAHLLAPCSAGGTTQSHPERRGCQYPSLMIADPETLPCRPKKQRIGIRKKKPLLFQLTFLRFCTALLYASSSFFPHRTNVAESPPYKKDTRTINEKHKKKENCSQFLTISRIRPKRCKRLNAGP